MGKINHENTKVRKHETRHKKKMNIEHRTSNVQHRMKNEYPIAKKGGRWKAQVTCPVAPGDGTGVICEICGLNELPSAEFF
jgi:RecJ-like exonuclease